MATIGVRELRQNASVYLARVTEGESIAVSVRGKVVARLVPAVESRWDALVAEGHVRAPVEGRLEEIEPVDLQDTDVASRALATLREHER